MPQRQEGNSEDYLYKRSLGIENQADNYDDGNFYEISFA